MSNLASGPDHVPSPKIKDVSRSSRPHPSPPRKEGFSAKCENHWAEWVWMRLKWGKRGSSGIPLHLTINFSKHTSKLAGGLIEFGLKAGELCLEVTNAVVPMESRQPKTPLAVGITKGLKITRGKNETQPSIKTSVETGKPVPSVKLEAESKRSGLTYAEESTFSRTEWQITSKGSDEKPLWTFEVLDGNPYLRGSWEEKIGIVAAYSGPCQLKAHFTSAARHLEVVDIDGLFANWTHPMIKAFRLGVYKKIGRERLCNCELSVTED